MKIEFSKKWFARHLALPDEAEAVAGFADESSAMDQQRECDPSLENPSRLHPVYQEKTTRGVDAPLAERPSKRGRRR